MSTQMPDTPGHSALFPHQEALLATFFSPECRRTLLLLADAGLGKSAALIALVSRFRRERPQARILVLQPAVLSSQFAARLSHAGLSVLDVDRYRFRELRDAPDGDDIWPEASTVVMSQNFAAQPDVRASLAHTNWELLIVDEAHAYAGARASALTDVEQSSARVVLATAMPAVDQAWLSGNDITIVEWRHDAIAGESAAPQLAEVRFELSTEERRVALTLREFGQALGNEAPHRFLATVVESAFRSSPAAVESVLQRFTDSPVKVPGEVDDQALTEEAHESSFVAPATQDTRALAARALAEMEELDSDSKLASLRTLLSKLSDIDKRVCVVTSYLGTVYYLAAETESLGRDCRLLRTAMTAEDREGSLADFSKGGVILIATQAAITDDAALENVTDLVLYDILNADGDKIENLVRRFNPLGRTTQLAIHVLVASGDQNAATDAAIAKLRQVVSGAATG